MTLEQHYTTTKMATDFWLYLLVWSAVGRRPSWIGSRRAVKRAARLMRARKR